MAEEYVILNLGQSNAEPKALLSAYLALVPDMNAFVLTPDAAVSANYGRAVETIRFLTFYNPEATAAYPVGAPPAPFAAYTYDYYCKWLPWTINELGASNPNVAGFRYPNAFSVPRGPVSVVTPAYPSRVNSVVDLARRVQGWLKKRINVISLAVDSTQLQHMEAVLAGMTLWGWFDPRKHNNWSPSDDNGLFARLLVVLDAAKIAATAEGNTLKVILVTMQQAETDSQNANARSLFATNARGFVDAVRQAIYDRGMAEGSAAAVPFIWPQLPTYPWGVYPGGSVTEINTALAAMKRDDPYFETYATDGFATNTGDPLHRSEVGIMSIAAADFAALQTIRSKTTIAMPLEDVPTLAELRTEVRRITERNTSDAGQDDAVIDAAINDAYKDLINYVGDTCWWLRQMTRFTLNSSPITPVQLPRTVTRLLEIRPAEAPWMTIDHSMVGHADNGRVQIITLGYIAGLVDLHHMYEPRKLIASTEKPVLPAGYIEALKVGAARRVVEVSGNAALEAKLTRNENVLKGQVSIHANKVDRQRRQRLTGRRGARYRTGVMDGWGNYPWTN